MARGKVESINTETKKAVIAGKEVQLGKKLFNPKLPFQVGDTIEYEMKGSNFDFKRTLDNSESKNKLPMGFGGGGKKVAVKAETFSYPYNFVSFGNMVDKKSYTEKGNISGMMECEIITRSPLLIGGGEKKVNQNGHPTESFYKENGKYLIPASGLKGAIRNVFETVTNSCIKIAEDERLEKRYGAGDFNKRKFGIITKLPTEDTPGTIVEAEMIKIKNKGRESALPSDMRKEGIYTEFFSENIFRYSNPKIIGSGKDKYYDKSIKTEQEYKALVNKKNGRKGIIWVSSEIFMKSYDKILVAKSDAKEYDFSKNDYDDLKYLIAQRNERDLDDPKKGKEFYLHREVLKHDKELKEWYDPIVFMEENNGKIALTFSEIPRLRYKLSPKDLVPKSHLSCHTIEELCPSCRLFGMVDSEGKNEEKGKTNSLKGRVYFSDAYHIQEGKKEITSRLIKSLGEPHPSLTKFYLTDQNGYDKGGSTIRGRKFYWHHNDKIDKNFESFYKSIKADTQEKHNSTINCLDNGHRFNFTVKFENLTQNELEALVYSIQLEGDMLHKFGKAKAFGFGSCQVKISSLKLDNGETSSNNFTKEYSIANPEDFIGGFIKSISTESDYFKEFRKIMNKTNSLDFSQSPFPEAEKNGKINTVQWFMNKKKELGESFVLPKILQYK